MKCLGCGVELQWDHPKEMGYSPKANALYCQRCFRLKHYDDPVYSKRFGIDPRLIVQRILELNSKLIFVVDCFSIEESFDQVFLGEFKDHPLTIVLTKRDILPETMEEEAIAYAVSEKIHQQGLLVDKIFLHSSKEKFGNREFWNYILEQSKETSFCFFGLANAGKSSFLNQLLDLDQLTTSRYPGTTLDFSYFEKEGYEFVDTPGLEVSHSYLMKVPENQLKKILPEKTVVCRNYQVYSDQSYFLEGLFRLEVLPRSQGTISFYVSAEMGIHRTKTENADSYFSKHKGMEINPFFELEKMKEISMVGRKMDVVLPGLGWISLSGSFDKIRLYYPDGIKIYIRKAFI